MDGQSGGSRDRRGGLPGFLSVAIFPADAAPSPMAASLAGSGLCLEHSALCLADRILSGVFRPWRMDGNFWISDAGNHHHGDHVERLDCDAPSSNSTARRVDDPFVCDGDNSDHVPHRAHHHSGNRASARNRISRRVVSEHSWQRGCCRVAALENAAEAKQITSTDKHL